MANGVASKGAAKTMQKSSKPESKRDSWFKRAAKFLRDTRTEVFTKASWPNKTELRNFTTVVVVTVVAVGFYIAALDWALGMITNAMGLGFGR